MKNKILKTFNIKICARPKYRIRVEKGTLKKMFKKSVNPKLDTSKS